MISTSILRINKSNIESKTVLFHSKKRFGAIMPTRLRKSGTEIPGERNDFSIGYIFIPVYPRRDFFIELGSQKAPTQSISESFFNSFYYLLFYSFA